MHDVDAWWKRLMLLHTIWFGIHIRRVNWDLSIKKSILLLFHNKNSKFRAVLLLRCQRILSSHLHTSNQNIDFAVLRKFGSTVLVLLAYLLILNTYLVHFPTDFNGSYLFGYFSFLLYLVSLVWCMIKSC